MTVYVSVTYEIEEGGIIEGDEEQLIPIGTDASTITAVADEGYMFQGWSDGFAHPTRTDTAISENVIYTAIFAAMDPSDGDGGDEDGSGEGDQDNGGPGDSQDQGSPDAPSGSEGDPNPNAQAGGGKREPNNQIVDGNTFYREVIEYYQGLANDQMSSEESELTDEEIDLIKKYLGIV